MKKKDKIVSARVTTEVADILDIICEREGLTRNKVLSELITSKYNFDNFKNTLSPLEMLLLKISKIVDVDYNEYTKTTTPCILNADEEIDGDYFGKKQILVGDETCIREQDGKFYILNFHFEDAEIELFDEQEILDFYEGKFEAYNFPHPNHNSYHHIKGYVETAKRLLEGLEHFLEHKETERETEKRLEAEKNK